MGNAQMPSALFCAIQMVLPLIPIPPEDGPLVGALPDGPWNHPSHRLVRINVRLPCLQIHDTGQVGSILTRAWVTSLCGSSCNDL